MDALRRTFDAEELAKKKGLLQKLDPRIKIAAILPLILIAALARQLRAIVAIFVFAVLIGLLSRVPLITLAKRVWLATLTFTGLISIPALSDAGPRHLRAAIFQLDYHRSRSAGRDLPDYAGGNCDDFVGPGNSMYAVEQLVEGASRAPVSNHLGRDSWYDLPIHFAVAADSTRHV